MASQRKTKLTAFEVSSADDMPLQPAPTDREWMDRTPHRFAYRCLPLTIANQAGWVIGCPVDFSARWSGGSRISDLKVRFARGCQETRVLSHFGEGVLTFTLPYLFRTPRGVNLWVKGPSNWLKDGIQPLEGIVESDWNEATFTMNWKMTRQNHTVRFQQGEPICMIVPVTRGLAESLDPIRQPLSSNSKLARAYEKWCESRSAFNDGLARQDATTVERGWQRDYMLGLNTNGQPFPKHQTKLSLRRFRRDD